MIHTHLLRFVSRALLIGSVLVSSGCGKSTDGPPIAGARPLVASAPLVRKAGTPPAGAGVAWLDVSNGAAIDAAFERARRESKPVFVYWGAGWCPPCNQLKATLFNRQDFIARSLGFVPVRVDGDSVGAQKLGARFQVSGYPTMVLFDSRGVELTRLPGEVDPARYLGVLTLAMSATRPVAQVLAQALAGTGALTPDEWRLLAFYSWESYEQRLIPDGRLATVLRQLASACPPGLAETSQRLELQALTAAGDRKSRTAPRPAAGAEVRLLRLLGNENASRAQTDLIANSAVDIARGLTAAGTSERERVLSAFDSALTRMEADRLLSRADRLAALGSRVELARIDDAMPAAGEAPGARPPSPPLPPALIADVRETAARVDREITDGYERQAVVNAAADVLDRAGLGAESDRLLRANLGRSHSPYYLMSALARHAKERGDRLEALRWYQAAFDRSEGPSTRLQWGAGYLLALIDLDPKDELRIEAAAARTLREAGTAPDAFDGRSARSLKRLAGKLRDWDRQGGGSRHAVVQRLQSQLHGVCAALPAAEPGRTACDTLFTPGRSSAA